MRIIHFNYRQLRKYCNTYHPPEELRIQREINRLKASKHPFGATRVPHISKNARMRIIEDLVNTLKLPHPRVFQRDHFKTKLPGWNSQLQGLYQYYRKIRPKDQAKDRVIDFMLDCLDFQKLEDLQISEQIQLLRAAHGTRIAWDRVSKALKRYFVERLAEEAKIPHPRILIGDHFSKIEIPEIGSTLIRLHNIYADRCNDPGKAIETLLDDIGIPKLNSLPWELQLECLKQCGKITWERIPESTQLRLIKMLKERVPPQNGIPCPHLRALTDRDFKLVKIDEIGIALGGLYENWRRKVPKDYKGDTVDYILDQYKIEKFEELSYELQCLCLRYDKKWPWKEVPKATRLRFLEQVRELAGLPHLRFLGKNHLREIKVPDINRNLKGLYEFVRNEKKPGDKREVIDIILDELDVPKFSEMPFELQLKYTQPRGSVRWGRVPDTVILHYLGSLVRTSGGDLFGRHFSQQVEGKESGLQGLRTYLYNLWPGSQSQTRMIDWAMREYGVTLREQIRAKRYHGAGLLDREEKGFLIQMAKLGSREAMEHLIYFYKPLIIRCIYQAVSKVGYGRKTFDELLQIGRIYLSKLIGRYDPNLASFETYVISSLPWHIFSMIVRGTKVTQEISLQHQLDEEDFILESRIGYENIPSPERIYYEMEFKEILDKAIEGSGLNRREKEVIRKRRLQERTLEDVGQEYGLTRERIRQIEKSALQKIANGPYVKKLNEFIS